LIPSKQKVTNITFLEVLTVQTTKNILFSTPLITFDTSLTLAIR